MNFSFYRVRFIFQLSKPDLTRGLVLSSRLLPFQKMNTIVHIAIGFTNILLSLNVHWQGRGTN